MRASVAITQREHADIHSRAIPLSTEVPPSKERAGRANLNTA
jgi:hypothetical protein